MFRKLITSAFFALALPWSCPTAAVAQFSFGPGSAINIVGSAIPDCTDEIDANYIIVDAVSATTCDGGGTPLFGELNYCVCDHNLDQWTVLISTIGSGGTSADSVFGRTGDVVAQANDYSISQVTGGIAGSTLASAAAGQGATLIGVEDAGGNFTGAEVETVLAELHALVITVNTDDQVASQVDYSNATSGLAAGDVQEALDELDATVDGLGAGGGAPAIAPYVTSAADATLTNETVLDSLIALNVLLGTTIADGPHAISGSLNLGSGTIRGAVSVETVGVTGTESAAEGQYVFTTTSMTRTLPAVATSGQSVCYYTTTATILTIDPAGTDPIVLNGAILAGGVTIVSPALPGSLVCLLSDGTHWHTMGMTGAWSSGS